MFSFSKALNLVVVRVFGGMGNQFFQYAAGRAMAARLNTQLVIDASTLRRYNNRDYALQNFCIKAEVADGFEPTSKKRFFGLLPGAKQAYQLLEDPVTDLNTSLLHTNNANTILDGYWGWPSYFKPVQEPIRNELQLHDDLRSRVKQAIDAQQLDTAKLVAVHVRRGDYVTDKDANALFGLLNAEYYRKAITTMLESVQTPELLLFSDEPEVAEHLIGNVLQDIKWKHAKDVVGDADYLQMGLMQQCRHFIIANSTFSWWGSWLGMQENSIVIQPQRWYHNAAMHTAYTERGMLSIPGAIKV